MIVNRWMKWAAAAVVSVATVPAVGLAHAHKTVQPAVSVAATTPLATKPVATHASKHLRHAKHRKLHAQGAKARRLSVTRHHAKKSHVMKKHATKM